MESDWKAFVDALRKGSIYKQTLNSALENYPKALIYDFEFIASTPLPNDSVYQQIYSRMFENFNVKRLSFVGLNISKIDKDTFSRKCCASTLESLNLSSNHLRLLFDPELLVNLKRLERIDLSNNKDIQFRQRHFKANKNLRHIDLSRNELQFLPDDLFYGLHEIESINLNHNQLHFIDTCMFNQIQSKAFWSKTKPADLHLLSNPIDCDCHVFYLSRYANFNLNLTCHMPSVYRNRTLNQLRDEDPSKRCEYAKMTSICMSQISQVEKFLESEWFLHVAAVVSVFTFMILLCCCFSCIQTGRLNRIQKQLKVLNKRQMASLVPKRFYVDSSRATDTQKLVEY